MINLVKNALKFTPRGKIEIEICYLVAKQMLIIHVKDTGSGIASEDFPKLFTRFGKLQRTAAMNSEGIGLGLTIVKQIVELSGGSIGVHSDGPGLGSVFGFTMQMEAVAPGLEAAIVIEGTGKDIISLCNLMEVRKRS